LVLNITVLWSPKLSYYAEIVLCIEFNVNSIVGVCWSLLEFVGGGGGGDEL